MRPCLSSSTRRHVTLATITSVVALAVASWGGAPSSAVADSGSALVVEPPVRPPPGAWRTQAGGVPAASPYRTIAPEDAFALDSRPSARITLYVNFTGHDVTGSVWEPLVETPDGRVPAWDLDGRRGSFSVTERRVIIAAWEAVAEDYAPFAINVTTRPAPLADLTRDDPDDARFGSMIVVTDQWRAFRSTCNGCSGLAFRSVVDPVDDDLGPRTGFAIIDGRWGHPAIQRYLGDAITHEAGHHYGLSHRGVHGGEYHLGHRGWAPLMGASTGLPLTQWSDGGYAGGEPASQHVPDLAVIAAVAPLVPDDHGDDAPTATRVGAGSRVGGLIGRHDACLPQCRDLDVFGVASSRPVRIRLAPTGFPANLIPQLTVRTAAGTTTLRRAARRRLSVVLDPRRGAGDWTLQVSGIAAAGSPSAYGSLGHYRLSTTRQPRRRPMSLRPAHSSALRPARAHRLYRAAPVELRGGYAPYVWTAEGLPAGLRLNGRTGVVSGYVRPSAGAAGRTRFTVTDASGARATVRARAVGRMRTPARSDRPHQPDQ